MNKHTGRQPAPPRWLEEVVYWLQPPVAGAYLIFDLTGLRILWGLPFLIIAIFQNGLRVLVALVWVILVATTGGGAAGVMFSILQPLRTRWPRVWAFVAGYACTAAYLATTAYGLAAVFPEFPHEGSAAWFAWAFTTAIFGFVVSAVFYDRNPANPHANRPPSRWVLRLEQGAKRFNPMNLASVTVTLAAVALAAAGAELGFVLLAVIALLVGVDFLRRKSSVAS